MKLSKFDTEIWMTDHEGDCLYNLADTCVKPMTIKDLEELIHKDVEAGHSYVCVHEDAVVGTFFYISGENIEPTYARIWDGAWRSDAPYGVVHRIAGDGSMPGIGTFCMQWAWEQCRHLRVDTHGDNVVMQHLLEKLGFVRCGTIYVEEDPFPRIAYEKTE